MASTGGPERVGEPELAARVRTLELEPLAAAAGDTPVYLVGGAVRDLLLGRDRTDIDVALEGDPRPLVERIGGAVREHGRFGTATVEVGGREVDVARTRAESYPRPGALPEVRPASLLEDLARRDFTINAMAIPLAGEPRLIDPHGGYDDLFGGRLAVLHDGSLVDDPTRALRCARYAARLDFGPEPRTDALLREADLGTVSSDRIEADLLRLADERSWRRGFELLRAWGLVDEVDLDLMEAVSRVLDLPRWSELAPRGATMLAAGRPRAGAFQPPEEPVAAGRRLSQLGGGPPSRLASAADGQGPTELVIGRALGADWLDRYLEEWRDVRLEISGEDLLGAGIAQGPRVGRGLAAALAAKLDGRTAGREDELRIALEVARDSG